MTDAEILELPEFIAAFDALIAAIITQKAMILSELEIELIMERMLLHYHANGHFNMMGDHLL